MSNKIISKSETIFRPQSKSCYRLMQALLISIILIFFVFPDVVFHGASLRVTDQVAGMQDQLMPHNVYPIPAHSHWWDAYQDNGGALFQSDPMVEFMRFCFRTGNSPLWNPYSAAGSLGPDSLVDQKFSLFTAVNALLGGSSLVFNITLLISYTVAVFFLYRLATERLQLSALAGVAMSIFYLLNGYSTTNIGTNIIPSYIYGPAWLYFSLSLADGLSTTTFVGTALTFAILFSSTFVPTDLMTAASLYALIMGYVAMKYWREKEAVRRSIKILGIHALAMLAGAMCLAVVYLPVVNNLASTGILSDYTKRIFQYDFVLGIPSLFSPSLLFESYNATEQAARTWYPVGSVLGFPAPITGNLVYHFGIIPLILIGCAARKYKNQSNVFIAACAITIFLVFCRIFNVPVIAKIIKIIPIFGNIGLNYWWAAVFLPAAILVGYGTENLQLKLGLRWPALVIMLAGICLTIARFEVFGLHEPYLSFKIDALIFSGIISCIALICCLASNFSEKRVVLVGSVALLIILMFCELTWDAKAQRYPRNDFFSDPPPEINFLQHNVGLFRTINFGQTGLYPEIASAFQIAETTSMNEGLLSSYRVYFDGAFALPPEQVLSYTPESIPHGPFPTLAAVRDTPDVHKIDWNSLDLLGVKYLVMPSNFFNYRHALSKMGKKLIFGTNATVIFENPTVLPRAFAVEMPTSNQTGGTTLPDDFRSRVVASEIVRYRNTNVEIHGVAKQPSLVVLTDNWQDKWHATLNGTEVPIVKVNSTFRGVYVKAGPYEIKMTYRLPILPFAVALSTGTILLLLLMLVFRKKVDRIFGGSSLIARITQGIDNK